MNGILEWMIQRARMDIERIEDNKLKEKFMNPSKFGIGQAIEKLKEGLKLQRDGWNGKGMFIVYQKAYPDGIAINQNTAQAIGEPVGTVHKFLPYLMMRTAGGEFVPWLASQTDILAEDWQVVE